MSILTGTIHQVIAFEAKPELIYDLIMDAEKHSEITGSEVTMSQNVDGVFSIFDGYCTGYTIELIKSKKIKQAWNFKEEGWPDDHFSICTFIFTETQTGCTLDFTQTDVPQNKVKAIGEGWQEYYWNNIKEYLETLD